MVLTLKLIFVCKTAALNAMLYIVRMQLPKKSRRQTLDKVEVCTERFLFIGYERTSTLVEVTGSLVFCGDSFWISVSEKDTNDGTGHAVVAPKKGLLQMMFPTNHFCSGLIGNFFIHWPLDFFIAVFFLDNIECLMLMKNIVCHMLLLKTSFRFEVFIAKNMINVVIVDLINRQGYF